MTDWTEGLTLHEIFKQVLVKAMARNNGNKTHAAKELGVSQRSVRIWLKRWF